MTETLVRPNNPRRLGARALEILLGRLPPGRWARAVPGLEALYARHVMARRDHTGLHSGVYPSYEAALADIPPSRLSGWDHDNSAALWLEQIDPVRLSTYPVFFWIVQLLREGDALVDVGGSIGLTYYGYRRLGGRMPPGSSWTVVEVGKIATQGRQVAAREQANDLHFVDQLAEVKRCDVLLSAGALHYMPQSLPGLLESLPSLPRHIVLNKLPMTNGPDCWTLQNYGPAVTPTRLLNERQFLEYFRAHGYRLRERWDVSELDVIIPFHPEHFIKQFAGFLLERN
jgi:putative methyltransferase (TIGR04325 family)